MATLAMGVVGAAIGFFAGGGVQGAIIGFNAGVAIGGMIFPGSIPTQERGKLNDVRITGSAYGLMIPQVFGRTRLGGNVVWATPLQEHVQKKRGGGKGGGPRQTTKIYTYSTSMAVMLCRGPVSSIRRIWGEDKLIYDAVNSPGVPLPANLDVYFGTEDQLPSSVIEAVLGVGNVPAYRGYCYLVFEDFDLTPWGGRIPAITVEVDQTPAYDRFALTQSSLQAYYRFEDAPGLLQDSGPNNWDLTGTGAVQLASGDVGEALDFTTTGNTLVSNIGNVTALQGTEISLDFRLKYKGSGSGLLTISYGDDTDTEYSVNAVITDSSGGIIDSWVSVTAGFQISGSVDPMPQVTDGNWHHVALTYKAGGRHRVWVDGVLVGDAAALGGTLAFGGTGKRIQITDSPWYLDEVAIYSRELTEAEIATRAAKSYETTVGTILADLFEQEGLTPSQYDVAAATDTVDGFIISSRTSVRDAIDPLLRVYQVDLVEVDGQVKAVKRGGAVVATLTEDDLGAHEYSGSAPSSRVEVKRVPDLELPFSLDLNYFTAAKDYEQANQRATRLAKLHVDERLTISTPLVLEETFARQQAERMLYTLWLEREQFSLSLMPQWAWLAPGDCVNVPTAGGLARVRITAMDLALFGAIPAQGVLDDAGVLTQVAQGGSVVDTDQERGASLNTILRAWSPNALIDADADSIGFYGAAAGDIDGGEWVGCVLMMSRDSGATYQSLAEMTDPAVFGVTQTTLAAPGANVGTAMWDRVNTVDVLIQYGTDQPPTSASELEVLNGANAVLLGDEVVRFVTVTPLGGDAYRLSNLLRGQRGTDPYWGSHANGERAVFLETGGSIARVDLPNDLVGKTVQLKAVTFGQEINDVSPAALAITGDEFKPYSGCDGNGTRHTPSTNDWTIEWKRRSRCDSVWADFLDAAMCEDTESYEAEILNGMSVVRTVTGLTASTFVYTEAQQITDFTSAQSTVTVRVYQLGLFGRGYPFTFTVSAP